MWNDAFAKLSTIKRAFIIYPYMPGCCRSLYEIYLFFIAYIELSARAISFSKSSCELQAPLAVP